MISAKTSDFTCDKTLCYNLETAIHLCDISYKEPNDINCQATYISHDITDTQCYIFSKDTSLIVCFRGTSSLKDVKTDLDILLVDIKIGSVNCKVHSGFYKQYISIADALFQHISKNLHFNELIICGHSLGGALATFATLDLIHKLPNCNIKCITFGSPRVGDMDFVNLYNKKVKKSYRIVNHRDPIQYFPIHNSYYHVHPSICFKQNIIVMKYKLHWSIRILNLVKNINWLNPIKYHKTQYYAKKMSLLKSYIT
jgi:predicted lipase